MSKSDEGAAVEKATNPSRRFIYFSRVRRSFGRAFAASSLSSVVARQNRHATQATKETAAHVYSNHIPFSI